MEAGDSDQLESLVRAREGWLHDSVQRLAADDRIVAVWLSGSMARGTGDAWADLDLCVVVPDEHSSSVLTRAADGEVLGELLAWCECPFNAPVGGSQVLARYRVDGHLVMSDINVWPLSFASKFPGTVELIPPRQGVPTTDHSQYELLAQGQLRPAQPYSRMERAEWETCMIHVATAFPPRGHDADRMLGLIGAERPADRTPRRQLDSLIRHLETLRSLMPPVTFDASMHRLHLAEASLNSASKH